MNRLGRAAAWLGALLLGLVGCGDGDSSAKDSSRAAVVSFTAERESLVQGESTILHWETRGASEVILSANGLRIDQGDLPLSGSLEVSPDRDTTYRLEAVRKGGASTYREVFVEVAPFGAPRIEAFAASPEQVRAGQPVTLSYRVQGASALEISTTRGEVVARPKGPEGEVEVRPTRSTTYVLHARNAEGETSALVDVTVGHLPSIQLVATPSQLDFGEELVLRWTVQDADSVVVTDPAGAILFEGSGEDGSVSIAATLSGAYRARAEGLGGVATAETRVVVRPVVELFQATIQGSLRPGMPAFVEWKVKGAERIEIFADAQKVLETTEAEGTADLPVSETGSFTLHAWAGSLDTRASADVLVTGRPVIRSLTTGTEVSAGRGVAAVSTVAWEVDGAAKLILEVEPGGRVDLTDKSPRIDEVEVLFSGPGTVTLIASNQAGETRRTVASPVVAVPGIERLFAAPSRVGSGEAAKILWETADAHTVVLLQDGQELPVTPSDVNGSFLTDILGAPATFELRAYNRLGHEVRSDVLTVEVGAPDNLVFGTGDGMILYRVGERVDLVWANDGGSRLTVTDQATGDVLCSTSDWLEIREGGCTIRLPEVQTKLSLVLEVANGSGTDVRTLDIHAVTGPIILDFQTDATEVTEGQSVLFSWVAVPDADGNLPTLELVDDLGNVFPLDDVEPLAGSKRFRMEHWGLRTFTLTAKAENPPPYSVTTQVMVHGIPTVDSLAANPPFAEEEGDPITFSWSTTHGASLELYLLDRQGQPQPTPVHVTSVKSEVDQGSATIRPTIAHPNVRVVVRNPVGHATEADFRIGVDPATVASFTANGVEAPEEVDLVDGEDLTLAWQTLRSNDVLLLEEFVDLRQRPNAVDLGNIGSSSSGKISFEFPEGFVFPYDGGQYTSVQIANSGYLTFDMGATASGVNQPLPYTGTTASYRAVDLAPFWDSLMNAKIWWELIEGEVDRLVIQWTNVEFSSSTYNPADLNFQVVLFEDGRFEYRYGKMGGAHAAARGSLATIGAQSTDCSSGCTFGVQLVYNTEQPNGLEGRVYRFDGLRSFRPDASTPVPVPKDGSLTFKPTDTRTYTLRAWNGHSEHQRDLRVVVHPRGRLEVWTEPMEPEPGESVDLHWSGRALTSLVIEDAAGNVVHTASPAELEGGSIALGVLPQGTHRYTLRGVGQLPRDQVVQEIDVAVFPPFALDEFTVSSDRIKLGETVTLSWAATNATSVQIEAFPGGLLNLPSTPDGGTVQDQPQVTTRYVLTVESHGRVRTEERTVEVRTAWIDDFQISRTEVALGGSITLDWEVVDPTGTARTYVEPFWREHEMREVTAIAPFQTIVGNGGVEPTASGTATTGYTDVIFPDGFVFPYFGRQMTRVRAFNYGYLNFGTAQSTGTTSKYVMPRSNTTYPDGVMSVFWASLSKQTTGRIFTKYVQDPSNPEKDHLIIEWANFQFSTTSYNPADLNFQVVLFRDGTFDYRFGTMASANAAQAAGSAAGIGYNVGDWGPNPYNLGFQLLYNLEMPGGVANRSWRYEPPKQKATGSWTFEPQDSGLVRFCIETETWKECEEQFVTVFKPGDIVISELMVDPGSGSYQWFEIRNLAAGPFDLEGKTIRMGQETHVVQTGGAFLIPPGGYAVLAQVDDPALGVDYAYGLTMAMETPAGNVAIEWDGTVLGETAWTAGWTFTPGVAKELLTVQQRPGTATRTTAAEYCDSAEDYGVPGLYGTPGGHGGACANVHGYEVDFAANRPFIDIRDTGRPIPHLTGTGQTYEIPGGLGFTMPFFSGSADTLWLSSYGLLGLTGAPSTSSANRQLGTSGTASGQGLIAPFWDSITTFGPDSMVYWDRRVVGSSEVLIVQFVEYKYNSTSYPGYFDFQVQLWDNGDIVFGYGEIWRTIHITNTLRYYEGYSATIGIEALNGTDAITYLYNQPLLRPYQSFLFRKL